MNQQDIFACTQIITFNPVMDEPLDTRAEYFLYLKKLIHLVKWDKRKYTKAQIAFYKGKLCGESVKNISLQKPNFHIKFSYLLLFDLAIMLAYHQKIVCTEKLEIVIEKIISDFRLPEYTAAIFGIELEASLGNEDAWKKLSHYKPLREFKDYIKIVRENTLFIYETPYKLLITATMSAGKSTLINALIGRNISLMRNMACTSKIHTIVSKRFDDGIISEYDHDMSIDATKEELMNDNDKNRTFKITVGAYFNGLLGEKRVVLLDSPGVNSSENIEHTEISQKTIRSKKYKLMVYVLNATQLGTTDEEQHLEVVAKHLGRTKIIFVMNKIDHLISEDDSFLDVIERQRKFLVAKGFSNPIICPVSSRAAFLAKKSKSEGLSRIERREIENYMDKFEQLSLQDYYIKQLNCTPAKASDDEVQKLLNNCGFNYFEEIIQNTDKGGNTNGTGLC